MLVSEGYDATGAMVSSGPGLLPMVMPAFMALPQPRSVLMMSVSPDIIEAMPMSGVWDASCGHTGVQGP